MIWGAISWNWKSLLVFLTPLEGKKGIYSKAYLQQVLEPIIFPLWDSIDEEERAQYVFIENRAKIHKGKARLPRLERGIRGLN